MTNGARRLRVRACLHRRSARRGAGRSGQIACLDASPEFGNSEGLVLKWVIALATVWGDHQELKGDNRCLRQTLTAAPGWPPHFLPSWPCPCCARPRAVTPAARL